MSLTLTAVTPSSVRIRYDDGKISIELEVPKSELKGPPKKLGMFKQADVDWGYAAPPAPRPFEELTLAEIETAARDYVQRVLKKSP